MSGTHRTVPSLAELAVFRDASIDAGLIQADEVSHYLLAHCRSGPHEPAGMEIHHYPLGSDHPELRTRLGRTADEALAQLGDRIDVDRLLEIVRGHDHGISLHDLARGYLVAVGAGIGLAFEGAVADITDRITRTVARLEARGWVLVDRGLGKGAAFTYVHLVKRPAPSTGVKRPT